MRLWEGMDIGGGAGADDRFWWQTPHQDYSTHNITFPFPIRNHTFHPFSGATILQTTKRTNDTYGIRYIVNPRQVHGYGYGKDILSADQRIRKGDLERIRLYRIRITLHDYTGSLVDTDTRFCLVGIGLVDRVNKFGL
jgi:hypothetical protein